jgi:hypothetical protein
MNDWWESGRVTGGQDTMVHARRALLRSVRDPQRLDGLRTSVHDGAR